MKKRYKVTKLNGLYGVFDFSKSALILENKYEFAEIFCDKYFLIQNEGRKSILNDSLNLIFDFQNQANKNQFNDGSNTYTIISNEYNNTSLSFFGENKDNTITEKQICKLSIFENKPFFTYMSKLEYQSYMEKEVGLDFTKFG